MPERPFGLTEKEAEVLRLVDRTRTTGEIAAIVGRSTSTVDHQIKSARRRMGGLDRHRAAERFREAEYSQTASRHSKAIPTDAVMPEIDVAASDRVGPVEPLAAVREDRATYDANIPADSMEDADDPAGLNTSPLVTIVLIVALAAAIMIVILAIPALISSAGQLTQLIRSQM